MMKVLNVAGDDRAARTIAHHLAERGHVTEGDGLAEDNTIYEFKTEMNGRRTKMIMTSASGLLRGNKFQDHNVDRNWSDERCDLSALFDAPIKQIYDTEIQETLEVKVKKCKKLVIWTYCGLEGDNMGFKISKICQAVKPEIETFRARFSSITPTSLRYALDHLEKLNRAISNSVDVRRTLDFKIGAVFTRFQTKRIERKYPNVQFGRRLDYGSCRLPTLGFAVKRYLEVESFTPESFRTIKVTDIRDGISVEFKCRNDRLLEELRSTATVKEIRCETGSKKRPVPLNTVELAQQCSNLFKLPVERTMEIALYLYNAGFISYPYTQTNRFPDQLDLSSLVQLQTNNSVWGTFAERVLTDKPSPQQGDKSDGAHSPIYPTGNIEHTLPVAGERGKVYEFIVRRFLACLSKDAQVEETFVNLRVSDKEFEASGRRVIAKNYLDVYQYENFDDIKIHEYEEGQTFSPTIERVEGVTSPPNLLTESDLITLMQEHGIGGASTYHNHIGSIKEKKLVILTDENYLKPTSLGLAIIMGYSSTTSGEKLVGTDLRKKLREDLKLICSSDKSRETVLEEHLQEHKAILDEIIDQSSSFDATVARYLEPEFRSQSPIDVQEMS